MTLQELEPKAVWKNFSALNAIPRASKNEARVIAFMKKFGESLGLETTVDATGNVIIKKPGTPDMAGRQTIVLQAHLDMVHQKNADTQFDFDTQGIRSYVDGEWVKAEGTTLGADNGIGVASIMSLLESKDIPHPPIEALFTIDEETGMTGAEGLAENLLTGKIMLNLDSEEDDELTIGCAGGINTNTELVYEEVAVPAGSKAFQISVKGLKGGHSGIDIHLGRGNANKLITRLLYKMGPVYSVAISSVDGGSLRNAIPREAVAVITLPGDQVAGFTQEFERRREAVIHEFKSIEESLVIHIEPTALPEKIMSPQAQEKALQALYAAPNGVFRMSPDIPGLVETSSSLARVIIKDGLFTTQSLQRSSVESGKEDIANAMRATFETIGASVSNSSSYPGWAPDPDSAILKSMVGIYKQLFGTEPHVAACHAGLECGIIGRHYPDMDMISFGPTIKHPHSPDEKVNIASVQKFWKYLLATLQSTPAG